MKVSDRTRSSFIGLMTSAHHCKDRHPYNLIMHQFYHPAKANGVSVPHILGLSASPVMRAKAGGLE